MHNLFACKLIQKCYNAFDSDKQGEKDEKTVDSHIANRGRDTNDLTGNGCSVS